MKKEIAVRLMKSLLSLGQPLNSVANTIEQIDDEPEKKRFRRAIAEIMAKVYTDLELKVIAQYPDLKDE